MAVPSKRVLRLQEFVAHSGNVNCLALGHKSGAVLVTGGDDKKVNLWAVGKSSCIMSLSGHTTSIQCVRFGHTENQVCAGSLAGTLKIWDLVAAKIQRSLTGHKGSIRAIEFHPYGDIITSGSSDTSVKLWDTRRKGCIFTYKGHTMAVNSLKFSPDGQWIASAGEEGLVKLWDLRTGRMLREFAPDTPSPVTSIEFHPHEFLLASASRDASVNFWDLEHFTLVSSTNRDTPHSRCLHFSSGGDCLYAAGADILRTYLWEPARTISSQHIPWGMIQDIVAVNNKLMGAAFQQMTVSLWAVDTTQMLQLPDDSSPDHMVTSPPFVHGNSLRKSFNKQKPSPEAKKSLSVKTIEESERSETDPEDEPVADIINVTDYRAVFQPNRTHSIAPQVLPSPQESLDVSVHRRRSISPHELATREPIRRMSSREETSDQETEFPIKLSSIHHSASETSIPRVGTNSQQRTVVKHHIKATSQSNLVTKAVVRETKSDRGPTTGSSANIVMASPRIQSSGMQTNVSTPEDEYIPMSTDRPTGLDFDDFLPKSYQKNLQYSQSMPDMSESEVLSSIMRGHESLTAVLEARNRNLQIVHSLWKNKDLKTAIDAAINMSDPSVIVDFLGVITNKPGIWNLDICVTVLPAIQDLLQSKFETYMRAGCDALRLIMRNFSNVIRTSVMSGSSALGVDIVREERYNKCVRCYNVLVSIRAFLLKRQTLQGALGQSFRELHISLQAIDAAN